MGGGWFIRTNREQLQNSDPIRHAPLDHHPVTVQRDAVVLVQGRFRSSTGSVCRRIGAGSTGMKLCRSVQPYCIGLVMTWLSGVGTGRSRTATVMGEVLSDGRRTTAFQLGPSEHCPAPSAPTTCDQAQAAQVRLQCTHGGHGCFTVVFWPRAILSQEPLCTRHMVDSLVRALSLITGLCCVPPAGSWPSRFH